MTTTKTVKSSEIKVGDIVRTYGMRCRVERVRAYEDRGSIVYAAVTSVLNPDEVREARVVPIHWLTDCRVHDHLLDHPEHCWHVQGNDLATWQVEVEPAVETNSRHIAWSWLTKTMSDHAASSLLATARAKGTASDRCNLVTYSEAESLSFRIYPLA